MRRVRLSPGGLRIIPFYLLAAILWLGIGCQCDSGPAACFGYYYLKTIELMDSTDTIRRISYPLDVLSIEPHNPYAELLVKDDGITQVILETDKQTDTIVFSAESRYYYEDTQCEEGIHKEVHFPVVVSHTFSTLRIEEPLIRTTADTGASSRKTAPCTKYYNLYVQ